MRTASNTQSVADAEAMDELKNAVGASQYVESFLVSDLSDLRGSLPPADFERVLSSIPSLLDSKIESLAQQSKRLTRMHAASQHS